MVTNTLTSRRAGAGLEHEQKQLATAMLAFLFTEILILPSLDARTAVQNSTSPSTNDASPVVDLETQVPSFGKFLNLFQFQQERTGQSGITSGGMLTQCNLTPASLTAGISFPRTDSEKAVLKSRQKKKNSTHGLISPFGRTETRK